MALPAATATTIDLWAAFALGVLAGLAIVLTQRSGTGRRPGRSAGKQNDDHSLRPSLDHVLSENADSHSSGQRDRPSHARRQRK
jgi:hypothetical protein